MRIKYITNVRIPTPRAHGYAIMKMCEEFSLNGANLELIIPDRRNNESKEDPFLYYRIKNNFNIRKIRSFDFLGLSLIFGKLFYWLDLFSFFLMLIIENVVKKEDVIYTRDFTISLLFSKKRFICLELHDIPKSNFLFNLAIKRPKLFFVLNNNIKLELVKMGVREQIIHVFPSGVDVKEFDIELSQKEAREKLNLPLDKKIVLYSGQFYYWKGLDTLAEASKLLPEQLFVFIGGTEPELSKFKGEYGNLKNVIVEPFKERLIIPFYLKSADVLVIPQSAKEKISTHYSSPLKMLEYMSSKRPIVASNLPSLKEILKDGENAIMVEPSNPEQLVEAIVRLKNSPELGLRLSDKAFEDVKEKYTWNNRAKTILDIIKK